MSLADVARTPIRPESIVFQGQLVPCSGKSILIYLAVDGALTPMRVLESDTIASVKLRIQKCQGFKMKKQKLVFEGRELARNGTLIKEYGVTGGNVLHLVLRLSDLLFVVVRTTCGKEFEFHIDRHRSVGYLKQRIKKGKCLVDLENQDLFCNGEKLDDQRVFHDVCKSDDDVIHLLVQKSAKVRAKPVEKDLEISVVASTTSDENIHGNKKKLEAATEAKGVDFIVEPIIVNPKIQTFPFQWEMMNSTYNGLKKGFKPVRSSEGTGGTYFMQDETGKKYVAVFKPIDEEPMALNNPRDLQRSINGEGLKIGTKVGEGAVREVAAYILDHPKGVRREESGEAMGFAGVPPTIMVKCLHEGFNHPEGFQCSSKHVKIGSLQMFMNNDGNCEDIGPRAFPVDEVHKITVLDIRLANADRHSGNILYRKQPETDKTILIPIDHGYCLPEKFEDCTFDWLYWPQARKPYSPETVEYIKSMDAEKDIELLKYYGWDIPMARARVLRISTMLLKKGVERSLTPYAIGSIMCRKNMTMESELEEMIQEARDSLLPGMSESAFLEAISQIMDSHLQQKQIAS